VSIEIESGAVWRIAHIQVCVYSIFRNLSETRERPLPYDVDLVDQRSKYGEGLLRRADDQRQKQMTWENEQTERHLEAVRRRQEERRKLEQIEVRICSKSEYGVR
jgi:hypothetical protein